MCAIVLKDITLSTLIGEVKMCTVSISGNVRNWGLRGGNEPMDRILITNQLLCVVKMACLCSVGQNKLLNV